MIRVRLWSGDKPAGDKFYSNTPGDQSIALEETEAWVGHNHTRCAHIVLTDTNYGIYIVRYTDEDKMPIFNDRLDVLRENLKQQERGRPVDNPPQGLHYDD